MKETWTIDRTYTLTFNRYEYDRFIDYIKGLCILFVLIKHSIPPVLHHYTMFALWGRLAVPLFILIQVFHTYKKTMGEAPNQGESGKLPAEMRALGRPGGKITLHYLKLWKRVVKPFLLVQLILLFIDVILFQKPYLAVISGMCHSGGMGAGGYYPWVYVQIAVLLVLLAPFFRKFENHTMLFLLFAVTSQLLEVLCCVVQMPEWLFRLCAVRYFFIIYLGFILANKGFKLNKKTFSIGLLSLMCLLFFVSKDVNLKPLFYTGMPAWQTCHWVNYFYVCYILLFVIRWTYDKLRSWRKAEKWIRDMGKYSYEIFMLQMIYFHICEALFPEKGTMVWQIVYMIAAVIICIVPVVLYKKHSYKIID